MSPRGSRADGKGPGEEQWPALLIHLLNTTTRMPFEILFVMLIRATVSLFALGIQCLHNNARAPKYFGCCIQLT